MERPSPGSCLSYHNQATLLFTIDPYHGNLNKSFNKNPVQGTALLGVRAVLAESFERIHRANLAGPLFP